MESLNKFDMVNINSLIPYAHNDNAQSDLLILQLRSSIRESGFVNPVIIDKELNIITGNYRVLAAKAEGMSEIPCVFTERLSETQKRAYIITGNKLVLSTEWDEEHLNPGFTDLIYLGFTPDVFLYYAFRNGFR